MKVAIIGYGRMGKEIEKVLLERGHEIALITNETPSLDDLRAVEVAIEFTQPESALRNLEVLIEAGIPTICGTTGWLENYDSFTKMVLNQNGAFLYASNYSLGVNLFFALNERLAELMSGYDDYQASVAEIHHLGKKDAPSGTAITLAESIIRYKNLKGWRLTPDVQTDFLPITALREPDVPGTHEVRYHSEIDDIQIKHTAHSRKGFALGAVIAAEWIVDKTGVFTMRDVLGL